MSFHLAPRGTLYAAMQSPAVHAIVEEWSAAIADMKQFERAKSYIAG